VTFAWIILIVIASGFGIFSVNVLARTVGIEISRADNDALYNLVIDVAAGQQSVDEIAHRLRQLIT
jgi:hypothetical protein